MPAQVSNMEDVHSLLTEMGKRVVHVKDATSERMERLTADTDNDLSVVTVLEITRPFKCVDDESDVIFVWAGGILNLQWNVFTHEEFRGKFESHPTEEKQCPVCSEYVDQIRLSFCYQCKSKTCWVCVMKMALTPETIQSILLQPNEPIEEYRCHECRCPECREALEADIEGVYVRVMDHLDEFTEEQQQALLLIKLNDPQFDELLDKWKSQLQTDSITFDDLIPIHLHRGCTVRLYGLKNKKWNRKKAIIIGPKEIKNGVIRWPIQLKGKCRTKALIKQRNLKKM